MRQPDKLSLVLSLAVVVSLSAFVRLGADDAEASKQAGKSEAKATSPAAAMKPKPLSDPVKKGLAYLANQQHADGGWGQGGGWRSSGANGGRVEDNSAAEPSDVGNSCIALLALIRAGNAPGDGAYAAHVVRGVDFILGRVEKADADTLFVTDVRNTQLQSKIGPYVDTFLAQLVMAELKGKMPDDPGEKRLLTAFEKTMAKVAKHQTADGNFAKNEAWASALSMALCSKGLNRAAQRGLAVPQTVLVADQRANTAGLDYAKGTFTAPARGAVGGAAAPSDAGVPVYGFSGKTAGLQEAVNTLKKDEKKNREIVKDPAALKGDRERAQRDLGRLEDAEKAQEAAVDGLIRRLDDKQFIQGFGSNGGEEFLSYMNISETLLVKGGTTWEAWDRGIGEALIRVQDKDGAWSGQHCITGRTFCTATALLTLMADRAPVPVAKETGPKSATK
jgi:hypothetical protein